jgi:hypothetical protein
MIEKLGKVVAEEFYPQSSASGKSGLDILWDVIPDNEKALCQRIAGAVLRELREPTPDMLKAADGAASAVINAMKSGAPDARIPDDVIKHAFVAMIDAAAR